MRHQRLHPDIRPRTAAHHRFVFTLNTLILAAAFLAGTHALDAQPGHPAPPDKATELGNQGNSQMEAKNYDAAIATYQTLLPLVSEPGEKAGVWMRISEAFGSKGDFADSLHALERAQALLPDNPHLLTNLGLLYEQQHDVAHARQSYEKAIAIDSDNPIALNNLAFILADTGGDLDLALSYARAAGEKLPRSLEIGDTLGWIYLRKNMIDDAVSQFRMLTENAPKIPVYHYHYAMALDRQGNATDAANECRAALNNGPAKDLEEKIRQECAGRIPGKK